MNSLAIDGSPKTQKLSINHDDGKGRKRSVRKHSRKGRRSVKRSRKSKRRSRKSKRSRKSRRSRKSKRRSRKSRRSRKHDGANRQAVMNMIRNLTPKQRAMLAAGVVGIGSAAGLAIKKYRSRKAPKTAAAKTE